MSVFENPLSVFKTPAGIGNPSLTVGAQIGAGTVRERFHDTLVNFRHGGLTTCPKLAKHPRTGAEQRDPGSHDQERHRAKLAWAEAIAAENVALQQIGRA